MASLTRNLFLTLIVLSSLGFLKVEPLLQTPTLSIWPVEGPVGTYVSFNAFQFQPDQAADLWWDEVGDTVVWSGNVDSNGKASGAFIVPGKASSGEHEVIFSTGLEENRTTFLVTELATDTPMLKATHTFTSTYPPGAGPSLTPTFTPTGITYYPGIDYIPPMQPLFNNPLSVLGSNVSRVPGQQGPCGGLGFGSEATVYTFDDRPAGNLTTGYPLVTFQTGTAYIGSPRVTAHSGGLALSSVLVSGAGVAPLTASDIAGHPILMDFSSPMDAVGMFVGREAPSLYAYESVVAVLTGYGLDTDGNPAVVATGFVELPGSPTPIDRCLAILAPDGAVITSAVLDFLDSSGRSIADTRWMDDLTLLQSKMVVEDLFPIVTITRPTDGSLITTDYVALHATINEDIILQDVIVSVNGNPPFLLPRENVQRRTDDPRVYEVRIQLPVDQLIPDGNSNQVEVVATDSSGNQGAARVTFNFYPASDLNIIVDSQEIEIVQVTQCIDNDNGTVCPSKNSVSLFPNKPTMVKVPVYLNRGGSLTGISGAMCLGNTGSGGCTNPVRPISPMTVGSHIEWWRSELTYSLNFIVPMDWLRVGTLTVTVYANYNYENVLEHEYEDNYASTSIHVAPGPNLDVIFVPMAVNGWHTRQYEKWAMAAFIKDLFPISTISVWSVPGNDTLILDGSYDLSDLDDWGDLLDELEDFADRFDGSAAPYVRWYGMIDTHARSSGSWAGLGQRGGQHAIGLTIGQSVWNMSQIAAHELGHNHGRLHASSYGGAENPDPHYRWPNGELDETGTYVRGGRLFDRVNRFDFMSYQDMANCWMSVYNYRGLHLAVGSVRSYGPGRSLGLAIPALQTGPSMYLVGGGDISPQGVEFNGNFFNLFRMNPLYDSLHTGPYTLELHDGSGNILLQHSFSPLLTGEEQPGEEGRFRFSVPWVEGTSAVVFTYNGAEIARRSASPNTPQVTLISPNGGEVWGDSGSQEISWAASDADGDALSYMSQISCDKGNSWMPLGGVTTATSMTLEISRLPGGGYCIVRVMASDGLNTGYDESDGLFSVVQKAPEVYISNPQETTELSPGYPVILMGLGSDPEDGLMDAGSMQWVSDRDGSLPGGDYLVASTQWMSPGEHAITLTGTDADGMSVSYTTTINLVPPPEAAVAEGAPPEPTSMKLTTYLLIGAGALVLVIGGVIAVVLRKKRKR